jgi:HK97 gp10 family phage protein
MPKGSGEVMAGPGFRVNFACPELQDVLRNMDRYNTRQAVKIEQAVSTSTKNIAKGARQRIPVRTGDLKKSVRSNFDVRQIQGVVRAKEYYAHLVEFGAAAVPSKNIPKRNERPFMRPAFEDEKPALIRGIREAVRP